MTKPTDIRILVGLDLSGMDRELIRYLGILQQWLPSSHITFLHSIKVAELPADMREPAKLRLIASRIESKIRQLISSIAIPDIPFDVQVAHEAYAELAFMEVVKKQQANLVLLGNKQTLEGSGGISQKLARMLPAAVMLLPESADRRPRTIVQAVDFSRYTAPVARWGRIIAEGEASPRMIPVYIHRMSYHSFPIFSEDETEAAFRQEAADKTRKWAAQYRDAPPLQVIPAREQSVASTLMRFARENQADFIILGVQGVTSLTNLFMGSVANEVLQRDNAPGLLLVKP
ncbi:universal stress protein [Chitinophaga sp.]|uniref:universal stress protein n=1 Tax=Chitinophaga sp. TaxID=1869181 RepID=UPI00260F24E0|nr:universal stress protein [uncultured Chitinophaga sp.]